MGGILGGLIGGIAKGAVGGFAKEGERQRRQKEYVDNLITRMHINRLEDWENLSPEQQQAHTEGLIKINPHLKDVLPTGIALAQAVSPHIEKAIGPPPEPRSEPIGGAQRPLDIPLNVQDMTPAKLPPPAIAPNAPLRPVPTLEGMLTAAGKTKGNTTPNERKFYEQELFKEQQAERARQDALYYKQQELATALQTERAAGEPEAEVSKMRQSREFPTYAKNQMGGTFVKEGIYKDKDDNLHNVRVSSKNPHLMQDLRTGQEFSTLPQDWIQQANPRDIPDQIVRERTGDMSLVNRKTGEARKIAGVKGPFQYAPTKTINDIDAEGRPIQRVLTTPEAVRESKQRSATGGGFAHPATADITKSTQGTRVLLATQRIRELTNQLQEHIGPFAGRWTDAQIKGGDLPGADPETKRLVGELDMAHSSLAAMLPKMHEFRSQRAAQEFLKVGPNWHKNPDLNMGNIDSIERLAKSFSLKDEYAPKGGNLSAPPTAGAAAAGEYGAPYDAMYNGKQVKVRKNLKTGKVQLVQ